MQLKTKTQRTGKRKKKKKRESCTLNFQTFEGCVMYSTNPYIY
jgi:hypothetical protein